MPEGYTLLQMRTKVRDVLRDSAAVDADRDIQDPEIDGWLNEAFLEIAHRTRDFRKEATGTWGATYQLAFPADFLYPLELRVGTDDVEFVDDQIFWDTKDDAVELAHPIGRVFGINLEVYPTPASGAAYTLRYVARPATLSADGNTPDIRQRWQVNAVRYAQAQALIALRDFDLADRYQALFEKGLPPIRVNEQIMPGPLSWAPALGPWDADEDARHI
jgi:hypothetical protein